MPVKIEPTPGNTDWFVHDRFGMFIHWGVYSVLGRGEWVMNNEKIPVAGKVIWMTPKGAQGKRTAGIGVQFSRAVQQIQLFDFMGDSQAAVFRALGDGSGSPVAHG